MWNRDLYAGMEWGANKNKAAIYTFDNNHELVLHTVKR